MNETLRIPTLSDDESRTLGLLVEQLAGKRRRNLLRSGYYDARHLVKQVGTVIPEQYQDLAMVLGWTAKGVDGLALRCVLDKMVWPGGDLESLGMSGLEESTFLLPEMSQGRTDSLIHGVSYLVTTQGQPGTNEPAALVHARDGLDATGEWNNRTRALDSLLSVTGWEDNRISSFVLYLDNVTVNAERVAGRWQATRTPHVWGVPAEPLVYKPRSSRRMGRSRITRPAMKIQDSAVRALIRLEAHMDIYAITKFVMLGANEDIFRNADGTAKSASQAVMGRIMAIPDDEEAENPRVDIEQFAAESPAPHLAQLNAAAKLMARETDLPDSDFALTDMANPTSEGSYVAGRDNLIAAAEGATQDWSVPTRRTVRRALAMHNGLSAVPESWNQIQPKWRSPLYMSKAAEADAGSKQLAAVPWLAETEVGLELLGLNEQQISRALAERRRAAGRAVLASLGQPSADGS